MSDEMMNFVAIMTAIRVAVFVALVLLQFFLSSRKNKWVGLIPIAAVSALDLYAIVIDSTYSPGTWLQILAANLPTLILFVVIHCLLRRKVKKQSQLEKMNIQDLD